MANLRKECPTESAAGAEEAMNADLALYDLEEEEPGVFAAKAVSASKTTAAADEAVALPGARV